MSELIHIAQKTKILAADPSLPKWQRLYQTLQAFSVPELQSIPQNVQHPFEIDRVVVDQVLNRNLLGKPEDYENMADADVNVILDSLGKVSTWLLNFEADRIVAELNDAQNKLPVAAIEAVREHRDVMIPKLIGVLQDVTAKARIGELAEGNAHFYAIFLLTELKVEEAFPVILEAFSLPGELSSQLFDDAVTSTLARILAQFAGDRPEVMDSLIQNPELYEYVRWSAAESYLYLVRDNRMTRDEAVERLTQHLRRLVASKDRALIGGLICVLDALAPVEALADIEEAFRLGLVDAYLINRDSIQRSIAGGEEGIRKALERCSETGIPDTIEELRTWASFKELPPPRPAPPPLPPIPKASRVATPRKPVQPMAVPLVSSGPRVGRNDPCLCGSGKKFKKCCGAPK